MPINYREHLTVSKEIQEILIADLVLILAFDLTIVGGVANIRAGWQVFLYFLPITALAVTLSFILHELMHKFTAQRFGAIAAFMRSQMGTVITVITAMFGFLIGIPGATVIYTSSFTKREEGIVSLAGPLTNFAVFLAFFTIGIILYPGFIHNITSTLSQHYLDNSYLHNAINFTLFISILLAFFNMLPIYPLDGSKILKWNPLYYAALIAAIFLLFITFIPVYALMFDMVIWIVIAFVFSMIYKGVGL
ncbi:MAG: site-2 protease family protein [Candidatus Marsarchaeota archaeon]|jgi:Zn-dependent protease|nr:site-2 protease family protein [Candidatus Marsarchaeota archaeon]